MNKRSLKRVGVAAVAAAIAVTGTALAPSTAQAGHAKVFVCKFRGTPGEDEVLKGGKNPISVAADLRVGEWFQDAHGRSVVIAEDFGQPAPTPEDCEALLGGGSGDL